jgi:predicted nucleic acid-binding protein
LKRRCYLDTSALRHLLSKSARTADVTSLVEDDTIVCASSQIAVTELHRMALMVPGLSPHEVDEVLLHLDLIPLDQQQLRRAGLLPHLPAGAQLRSLDALHIQAALDCGATEFITSDRQQGKAAKAAGLSVTLL